MGKPVIKVFISYAHDDEPYFRVFAKTLKTQLKARKNFDYTPWEDDNIPIGSLYNDKIQKQIAECDLAILCVSDNFLASEFIKAKEFGVLINKFPNTLLAPVLISPCEYKAWDTLAERQFFKPSGDKYDEATNDDFTFADLVRFNKKDGDLIPNPNIDRYVKDFIGKIEGALNGRSAETLQQQPVIKNHLPTFITSYPYFEKDSFFGRDELLKEIDDKINTLDLPLLLSGIGGMGKTAVAIAYGKEPAYNKKYDHIAWVDITENLFSNLFSTFLGSPLIPFSYSPDGDREKDIACIMQLLKQFQGNNLLLLDNANDETDLRNFVNAWKKYQPGWKCMLTTRCDNNSYKNHLLKLQVISLDAAENLFKQHNSEGFDKESFQKIYEYIGGHTFLIELLAKFGQESSAINSTEEILMHLRNKGIKELNKMVIAKQGQQQETDRLVSEFVLRLYDPLVLSETEQEYMLYFSVLPATDIEFAILAYLFGIGDAGREDLDNHLNSLFKKGWLIRNGSNFKCHQIIQEICREKMNPRLDNCSVLINSLSYFFETADTTQSVFLLEIGVSVIENIRGTSFDYALLQSYLSDRIFETGNFSNTLSLLQSAKKIFAELKEQINEAVCLERIGNIYRWQGNTSVALQCYQDYHSIYKSLSDATPENVDYQNGVAVSLGRLGDIYMVEGNIEEALKYYKDGMEITKSLSDKDPGDVLHKNNLAISLSRLGNIYKAEGNMADALKCYKEFNDVEKELYDKNPGNVMYKNNLAISYNKLGDMYSEERNFDEALRCYKEFNSIEKSLSDKNPENVEYKNNLAISYSRLGNIYQDIGELEEALKCYKEYNSLEKRLSDKSLENEEYKNGLAISFNKLGSLYKTLGNTKEALDCYKEDMKITKSLSEKSPENVEYRNGLAVSYTNLAYFYDSAEKKQYYAEAKKIWEDLVIKVPRHAQYKNNLDWVTMKLGEL